MTDRTDASFPHLGAPEDAPESAPPASPSWPSDAENRPRESELANELASLRARMISVAVRYTGSRDDAEDVVQSGYEKAVRNYHQFHGRSRFSTWLHRIVVNEALMWLRSEGRRNRHRQVLEQREPPA
ncbi:MAG: RNA polymerase sigma factor, partial [Proteobacteria bacterium]|nr:RNA polymerase sigma factor [Pseudomonadota bacterium]